MRPVKTEVDSERLAYVVPGAYLVRAGEMTVDQLYTELQHVGPVLIRRFLAHAVRSDYLILFNQRMLLQHCRIDQLEPPGETPEGSWAAKVKTEAATTSSIPVEVVEKSKISAEETGKKTRPGRQKRQMLKALITASEGLVAEAPTPPAQLSISKIEVPQLPPKPKPTSIPSGVDLLVRGTGSTHMMFRLRPFRVGQFMDVAETPESSGMMTIPHLTVYHPPRADFVKVAPGMRNKEEDTKSLVHVTKCHAWIKEFFGSLQACGLLPRDSCKIELYQPDISRLARPNLTSLQCRFRDDVPIATRNAVYAILRSSVWFHSLAADPEIGDQRTFLVRCWWRQVPVTAE